MEVFVEKITYSEQEVSSITGKPVQTLRNERHRRTGIPYVKWGKSVLYRKDDIEVFLSQNRINPEA
jgi:hypothetical protein